MALLRDGARRAEAASGSGGAGRGGALGEAVFGGVLRTVVRCGRCGAESARSQPFLDLPVPVPAEAGPAPAPLEALLEAALAPEALGDPYRCERCEALVPATRLTAVEAAPAHLLVTLLRFAYDPAAGERAKLLTPVALPERLRLPGAGGAAYALYAAVLHSGRSAAHGHYYAACRDSGEPGGAWALLNDSAAAASSFPALQGIPARLLADTAYILFYAREDPPAPAAPRLPLPPRLAALVAADSAALHSEAAARRRALPGARHPAFPPGPGPGPGAGPGGGPGPRAIF
eukprot:tig00020780_g13802.t1